MNLVNAKSLMEENQADLNSISNEESDSIVSFHAKVPAPLQLAMNKFIESYPNWDQYRLIKAALAGFLVQNGVKSRSITKLYVSNMFSLSSFK